MRNYLVKCVMNFTYSEVETLEFINERKGKDNQVIRGEEFYCTKEQYIYLSGNNDKKAVAVELLKIKKEETPKKVQSKKTK